MPALNDFAEVANLTVVRDAEFSHLGYLTSPLSSVLGVIGHERYLAELGENPRFAAVIVPAALVDQVPKRFGVAISEDPLDSFFRLHLAYDEDDRWGGYRGPTKIDPSADVHPTAHVDEEDVLIGPNTVVGPKCTVLRRTEIGADCVLHPGVVVGTEGFEVRVVAGKRQVVPHRGGVILRDRVELQANSCVSRSLLGGSTCVGDDTKTDNLVHIAHDCQIGERVRIAASAMLAGSITVGDDVWIGPGAVISSGLTIGDRASITIGAVVSRSVPADTRVTGHFAIEHGKWMSFIKSVR
ncbi:MAG: UDP-3-O-[3-hydroxymyristoyl] glucosamine N-acyltransferase [Bradymonadia bacterium]|jgi:UDP-3-O-[3-hydroxymyristoyl] glucosamine N-acyltransferase